MKQGKFSFVAAGIGLLLALLLARTRLDPGTGESYLPPLTLLFICEFGFLLTLAGAWSGGRAWFMNRSQRGALLAGLGCLALALGFLVAGLDLWQGIRA